jgi:hypothetical protein
LVQEQDGLQAEVLQVLMVYQQLVVDVVQETDLALRQVALEVEVLVPQCHPFLALMEMLDRTPLQKDKRVAILPLVQEALVVVEVGLRLREQTKDKILELPIKNMEQMVEQEVFILGSQHYLEQVKDLQEEEEEEQLLLDLMEELAD